MIKMISLKFDLAARMLWAANEMNEVEAMAHKLNYEVYNTTLKNCNLSIYATTIWKILNSKKKPH